MTIERLGILDFGGRRSHRPSWTAVNETVRAAQLADRLGYHRYWLAEHQSLSDGWGAAAVMVGHIAARTENIRVGSAGVLVSFHDAFDVASDYRLLEAMHPSRIDVGIAGGFPAMDALRNHHPPGDYVACVDTFVDFLRRRIEDCDDTTQPLVPVPVDVTVEMPWLLGSGTRSRDTALRHRTALCCSLFHGPTFDPAVVRGYLDHFEPTTRCPEPQAAICATVLCAETEAEAAAIHLRQAAGLQARGAKINAIGNPRQCAEQLEELADRFGVIEVVVHDVTRTVPERHRCYELLAEELLGLELIIQPTG
jgi:luciferase family oxidoreductase group 1